MLQTLYPFLLYIELGCGICVFILLLFISAPYGKHHRSGWGICIPARIAWVTMEFPAFFVILFFFIIGSGYKHVVSLFFIIIWEIHYIQRTFIYPFLIAGSRKTFPLLLVFMAFVFNLMNGFINGYYLFHLAPPLSIVWFTDPRCITGTILFLTGLHINLTADHKMRIMRKKSPDTYIVPTGWLYNYISAPNYFGEIIEWIGWAILTWSLPGVIFAIFTFSNLFPRALSNHLWYKKKFPTYPEKRKAIIPFLL